MSRQNLSTVEVDGSLTGPGNIFISSEGTGVAGAVTIGGNVKSTGATGTENISIGAGGNFLQTGGAMSVSNLLQINAPNGSATLGGNISTTGTTGNETLNVLAQNDIMQTAGVVTSNGTLQLRTTGGNVGTSAMPINIAGAKLLLTSASSTGNVYAKQTTTGANDLLGSSAGGAFQYTTAGVLTMNASVNAGTSLNLTAASMNIGGPVTAANGSLTLNSNNSAANALNVSGNVT